MTLIIGIKCSDGIVLGADSAATMSTATGLETIIQPIPKLEVLKEKVIVGVSGPVSLSQFYTNRIESIYDNICDLDITEMCRKLRNELMKDAQIAFQMASLAIKVLGTQAQASVISSTVVAMAAKNEPQLLEIDCQCNPEQVGSDIAFTSIGIGKSIADPLLAFIKHLFWEKQLPSLSEGRFAIAWTLLRACDIAPSGVRGPIQMAVLEIKGTETRAKKLTDEEIKDHEESVASAEDFFRRYKEEHKPSLKESEPPPP